MDSLPLTDWTVYLSVQAGAAATLTGLVFVAVSINLSRILSTTGLTGRAAESILQLFGVVIISTTALIPRQSPPILATELLGMGVALWLFQTAIQIRYLIAKTGHPRFWAIARMIQTLLSTLPFCVCGVLLLLGIPSGLYWLAPGCIFSLASGVANAWVLLVEILR